MEPTGSAHSECRLAAILDAERRRMLASRRSRRGSGAQASALLSRPDRQGLKTRPAAGTLLSRRCGRCTPRRGGSIKGRREPAWSGGQHEQMAVLRGGLLADRVSPDRKPGSESRPDSAHRASRRSGHSRSDAQSLVSSLPRFATSSLILAQSWRSCRS